MAAKASGFVKVGQADYEAIMRLAFGRTMEKAAQANVQGDSSKPIGNEDLLYGALAGVGSGLLSDMMTPLDEDESPVKRALVRILHGAALGGVAGLGIRTVRNMRGGGGGTAPAASEKNAQATNIVQSTSMGDDDSALQETISSRRRTTPGKWFREPNDQVGSDFDLLVTDPLVFGLGGMASTPLFNAWRNSRILKNRADKTFYTQPADATIWSIWPNSSTPRNVNPFSSNWKGAPPHEILSLERAYQDAPPGPEKLNTELNLIRAMKLVSKTDLPLYELGVDYFNKHPLNHGHTYTSIADAFDAAARYENTKAGRFTGNAFGVVKGSPDEIAARLARQLRSPYVSKDGTTPAGYDLPTIHAELARMATTASKNTRKATRSPKAKVKSEDIGKLKTRENPSFKGAWKYGLGVGGIGLAQGAYRAATDPHRLGGSWWDRMTSETEDRFQTDGGQGTDSRAGAQIKTK